MIYELELTDPVSQVSLDVWLGDRTVFKIENDEGVTMWTDLEGSSSSPIAGYYPDEHDYVYIDMTDYLRAHKDTETVYLFDPIDGTLALDVDLVIHRGINPAGVYIPYSDLNALFLDCFPDPDEEKVGLIMPPAKILMPFDHTIPVEAALYGIPTRTVGDLLQEHIAGYNSLGTKIWEDKAEDTITGILIGDDTVRICYWGYNEGYIIRNMTPLQCDKQYAYVGWDSLWGGYKRFVWEVTRNKVAAIDNYSLQDLNNEYVEIKGREESFTIRLDGLNMYDLWYYSDIITSSEVDIYGITAGESQRKVQVVSKSITLPDGDAGTDGVLEIEVKFAKYDAV